MSDYTQVTDFSDKDALTTGDPEKVISGADVDGEFSAISTAVASKLDEPSSPSEGDGLIYTSGSWSNVTNGTLGVMTTRGDIVTQGAASPQRVATGTAGQVLGTDGTDPAWASPITLPGDWTSASGSSTTISSIPSWARMIIFSIQGVSTDGTAIPVLQLGDSGGLETTGYSGGASGISTGVASVNHSSGFALSSSWGGTPVAFGSLTLSRVHTTTHGWVCSGTIGYSHTGATSLVGGYKALNGALDRVALVTTDTFALGAINVLYA